MTVRKPQLPAVRRAHAARQSLTDRLTAAAWAAERRTLIEFLRDVAHQDPNDPHVPELLARAINCACIRDNLGVLDYATQCATQWVAARPARPLSLWCALGISDGVHTRVLRAAYPDMPWRPEDTKPLPETLARYLGAKLGATPHRLSAERGVVGLWPESRYGALAVTYGTAYALASWPFYGLLDSADTASADVASASVGRASAALEHILALRACALDVGIPNTYSSDAALLALILSGHAIEPVLAEAACYPTPGDSTQRRWDEVALREEIVRRLEILAPQEPARQRLRERLHPSVLAYLEGENVAKLWRAVCALDYMEDRT